MTDPSGANSEAQISPASPQETRTESDAESASVRAPVAAIVLAAGKSTRMRSKLPKPLHPLCGLPMTAHVLRACREAGVERIVVVIGHESEKVRAGLGEEVEYALQETQRGTGDAVRSAQPLLGDWPGTILVLAGDVPLLPAETLRHLIGHQQGTGASATLLTAFLDDPTGYGRVVRDANGSVARIVEEKDATPEERAIREWNPSIYAFDAPSLWSSLAGLTTDNAQGEFYMTDTIGALVKLGARVEAVSASDAADVQGVNTRAELAAVAAALRHRILLKLMLSGVTVTDPRATYVDVDVEVGQDSILEPNTILLRGTRIGEDCVIGPDTRIEATQIGNGVRIIASHIEQSVLEDGVKIGPFAHLRPGSHVGTSAKIGNFVEVKNARLGAKVSASHLSYIGDAEIGEAANIGGGTITCNYDGFKKSRTVVGSHAFVGSNSTLIAPITIGDGAYVAAGSPITEDVPEGSLAIARERVTIKEGWVARFRERNAKP